MKNPWLNNNFFIFSAIAMLFVLIIFAKSSYCFIEQEKSQDWTSNSLKDSIWEKNSSGIRESEITSIKVHPENRSKMYVGTSKAVYVSSDKGHYFSSEFYIEGSRRRVNDIYISDNAVYVASDAGVFVKGNNQSWMKIFHSNSSKSQRCFSVIDTEKKIYIATSTGLFFKLKKDSIWKKMSGDLGLSAVFFIRKDEDYIYASTKNDLFQFCDSEMRVKKVFSVSGSLFSLSDFNDFLNGQEVELAKEILDFFVCDSKVFVATKNGIFCRLNTTAQWDSISIEGFSSKDITSIDVLDENVIIISSAKGVFYFSDDNWESLYKGLSSNDILCLAHTKHGEIFAGSSSGLFALKSDSSSIGNFLGDYRKAREFFRNEPSIQKVHQMAIEYAEVSPNKVKQWRQQATRKAWLPDLSVGVDGNKNLKKSDSLYGSYSSGGQQFTGTDDKTFYDNFGWDVSLSWDLGDLIWNSDQTSIDSRSKLMVELREDILDEVTRLYFERRRIQIELLSNSQSKEKNLIDQQMRIEELTALIDALTGGQFSQEINSIN